MSNRLFKLAKKAKRDSNYLLEFLDELSKVESVTMLQKLLEEYFSDFGGAILLRMLICWAIVLIFTSGWQGGIILMVWTPRQLIT